MLRRFDATRSEVAYKYRDYFYTCLAYCVTGILRYYVFQRVLPRALNIACSEERIRNYYL